MKGDRTKNIKMKPRPSKQLIDKDTAKGRYPISKNQDGQDG